MLKAKKKAVAILMSALMLIGMISVSADSENVIFSYDMSESSGITNISGNGDKSIAASYDDNLILHGWSAISRSVVTGKFGKDADDKSIRHSASSLSDKTGKNPDEYIRVKGLQLGDIAEGTTMVFGFKMANAVLDQAPSIRVVGKKSDGSSYVNNNFFKIENDGTVIFMNMTVGKIPGYKVNKWYDVRIVFSSKNGIPGSLYIDGVPYAENISYGEGILTSISEFKVMYLPLGGYPAATKLDFYIDDVQAWKYEDGETVDSQTITLDSADENIVVSDANIAASSGKTVADIKAAFSLSGYDVKCLKSDFSEYSSDSDLLESGVVRFTNSTREIFKNISVVNGDSLENSGIQIFYDGTTAEAFATVNNNKLSSDVAVIGLAQYNDDRTVLEKISVASVALAAGESANVSTCVDVDSSKKLYAYLWASNMMPTQNPAVMEVTSTVSNNFNSYDSKNGTVYPSGFWEINDGSGNLSPFDITGASGEDGDKAFAVTLNTGTAVTWVNPYMDSTTYKAVNTHKMIYEFDFKVNTSADTIKITGIHLWGGSFDFVGSGKYLGTTVAASTDKFDHIKIVSDPQAKVISFWVNGKLLKDKVPYGTYSNYSNSSFRFTPNQTARAEGDVYAGFAIDNLKYTKYTVTTAE